MKLGLICFLIALVILVSGLELNSHIEQEHLNLQTKINKLEQKIDILQKRIDKDDIAIVDMTSYTNAIDETNEDNENTACLTKPTVGSIAVSQDLYYKGWTCGKRIHVKGLGIFIIKDVMNIKWKNRIDIVKNTKREAFQFGIKYNVKAVLLSHYEKM